MAPSPPGNLHLRIVADKTNATRVRGFDPQTGEPILVNPNTAGTAHEPWPLKGVVPVDAQGALSEWPKSCRLATTLVDRGLAGQWLTLDAADPVVKPAGPADNPFGVPPHVFLHADAVVFKGVDGDVRYSVTAQPDKYEDSDGSRVDWFFDLKLEG